MDYLEIIEQETAALARAAAGSLDAPVRACPEWKMADLVWHVSEVHASWNDIAARRLQDWQEATRPERPADDALIAGLIDGAARLVATLTDIDPSTPVYSWSKNKTLSFIPRRMAQETTVHRWDAEDTSGSGAAIEQDVAADGIDEFLDLFLGAEEPRPPFDGPVAVHASDTKRWWTLRLSEQGAAMEPGRVGEPVATVSGRAEDLLLAFWGRRRENLVADPSEKIEALLAWPDLT